MHWDMKHMVAGNHARILELHTEYAATSSFGHESDARRRDAPSIRTLFCFCGVFGMCVLVRGNSGCTMVLERKTPMVRVSVRLAVHCG